MVPHDVETKSRLIAKIARELLASARFENLADLTDVLKMRLSALHIRCGPADLSEAYRVLASNCDLTTAAAVEHQVKTAIDSVAGDAVIPRAAAARIYRELLTRYRGEQVPRTDEREGRPLHFPNLVRV